MQTCPVARRRPAAGAVLAGLLLAMSAISAMPAPAAERVVAITADGLSPRELAGSPGDLVLVNQVSPPARLAVAGDLSGPGSPRGLGLPAVLAAVLVLGVASLLVRVLLAEPAGRRGAADPF